MVSVEGVAEAETIGEGTGAEELTMVPSGKDYASHGPNHQVDKDEQANDKQSTKGQAAQVRNARMFVSKSSAYFFNEGVRWRKVLLTAAAKHSKL